MTRWHSKKQWSNNFKCRKKTFFISTSSTIYCMGNRSGYGSNRIFRLIGKNTFKAERYFYIDLTICVMITIVWLIMHQYVWLILGEEINRADYFELVHEFLFYFTAIYFPVVFSVSLSSSLFNSSIISHFTRFKRLQLHFMRFLFVYIFISTLKGSLKLRTRRTFS